MAHRRESDRVVVSVEYQTNDGRVFAFLPDEIDRIDVSARLVDATKVRVRMSVVGKNGRPVQALLPVDIRLYDAAGRELDGAGPAVAKDGVCELDILRNADDAIGDYRLVCRDRASGIGREVVIK